MPPNAPQTLLPLETLRASMGWPPLPFYQLANSTFPITDACTPLVREYQWQRPKTAGRADIRAALADAEQRLAENLNFDVGVRYRQESIAPGYLKRISGPPQTYFGGGYGWYGGYSYAGWWRTGPALIQLNYGYLQKVATVSYSQLVTSSSLNYYDRDGDGFAETFVATFADATSDPNLVVIAISAADQIASDSYVTALSQEPLDWQVRPVKVTRLNANTLQAIGPAWMLVKPTEYEGIYIGGANNAGLGVDSSGAINPGNAANFVTTLTAWLKVYSNADTVEYVVRADGQAYSVQVPVTWVDGELGQLQVNLSQVCYPLAPSCWSAGMTEELRVNYEAGAPPQYLRDRLGFTTDWTPVISRYAIAELSKPICPCDDVNQQLFYWQEDLALVGHGETNNQKFFRVSNEVLECKLGTRRGAVEAWRAIGRLAQLRAVAL